MEISCFADLLAVKKTLVEKIVSGNDQHGGSKIATGTGVVVGAVGVVGEFKDSVLVHTRFRQGAWEGEAHTLLHSIYVTICTTLCYLSHPNILV